MIVLLVITDGRPYIAETLPVALDRLVGPVSRRVIYDDTGSAATRADLARRFPTCEVISHADGRQGFGGAIRTAWSYLRANTAEPYVFHLESDFVLEHPVDLVGMMRVLEHHPALAQLALLRQPVNAAEVSAGGVIEQHPGDYVVERLDDLAWRQHRRHFTTNPCLYRRALMTRGWPSGPFSEGRFGADLFADPKAVVGYWGEAGTAVRHVGDVRAGEGY